MVHSYIFQKQIEEINQELEDLNFGLMRLMVDAVGDYEIHETIIKADDEKEYIVSQDAIKVLKQQGQDIEAVELDSDNEEFIETLENLKMLVMGLKSSGIADCCVDIQSVAMRPEIAKNVIKIIEPQSVEDCYEFEILVEGFKYKMIDDGCPHIVEVITKNNEEHIEILSPGKLIEAVARINSIIIPIVESEEFKQAQIVELNKDAEFRQQLIDALRIKLKLMPSCVSKGEDGEYIIKPVDNSYLILPQDLLHLDKTGSVSLSSKLGRLMFKNAIDEINQSCNIILDSFEALKSCYENISRLSKIDNKPDFILDDFEDNFKDYFVLNLNEEFYAMHQEDSGTILVFRYGFVADEDENFDQENDFEEIAELLCVQQIQEFVALTNAKILDYQKLSQS